MIRFIFTLILCTVAIHNVNAFVHPFITKIHEKRSSVLHSNEPQIEQDTSSLDPDIARQFKVVICASDACNKKSRNTFGLEEYALFAGILERRDEYHLNLPLRIEEGTCMGNCKFGPCIGVEHEDYEGYVGLDGMKMDELQDRVFKTIVTDEDLDRVWSSVENGIRSMMEEESESDSDFNETL